MNCAIMLQNNCRLKPLLLTVLHINYKQKLIQIKKKRKKGFCDINYFYLHQKTKLEMDWQDLFVFMFQFFSKFLFLLIFRCSTYQNLYNRKQNCFYFDMIVLFYEFNEQPLSNSSPSIKRKKFTFHKQNAVIFTKDQQKSIILENPQNASIKKAIRNKIT